MLPSSPAKRGVFAVLAPWRHRLLGELRPFRNWDLNHSPEAHQNLLGAAPEMCRGVHQKGCDLEGVEGAAPPLTHSSKPCFLNPSSFMASLSLWVLVPSPTQKHSWLSKHFWKQSNTRNWPFTFLAATTEPDHQKPRQARGFFIALEPWHNRLPRELNPFRHKGLSHSPEAHQNFEESIPELCSGVHQKGCDLEGVEGAAAPNIHSLKP